MSHCVYDIQEIVSSSEFSDDSVLRIFDSACYFLIIIIYLI